MKLGPILLAISLASVGASARATPEEAPVRERLDGDARTKFDLGTALYKKAAFAPARDAFMAAYATSGDARILYNVAVCDKSLGHYARAIETLQRSLAGTDRPLPASYTLRASETIATLSRYVAFVSVEAPEGATITVDGEPARANPFPLDTGAHSVVVSKESFEPDSRVLNVAAGETTRVAAALVPSSRPGTAVINCAGSLACDVRVGDEDLGTAPVTLTRSAGSYLVRAFVGGRLTSEERVEIKNGKDIAVTLTPRPIPYAHLRVTTDDPGDAVTVDGKLAGKSGLDAELEPGEHRVTLSRKGGAAKTLELVLRDGETRDLRVTLDEAKRSSGISPWWFVGGGALVAGAAAVGVYAATRPTTFEGSAAGTLNPYVVTANAPGGLR